MATPFWIGLTILATAMPLLFTHVDDIKRDRQGRPNLGMLLFLPYCRILPMHLGVIFFGAASTSLAVLFFMALKTLADIAALTFENHIGRQALLTKSVE